MVGPVNPDTYVVPTAKDELQQALIDGEVTVIVGAGVSIGATGNSKASSWRGLLEHGIDWCADRHYGDPDAMRARLDGDDRDTATLLEVADALTTALGGAGQPEFKKWLRCAIGGLSADRPEALEALVEWNMPMLTTNYDELLLRVHDEPGNADQP